MIDALISGRLFGQPAERMSKAGKPFATCKIRAAAGDGEGLFINVVAFSESACAALLALDDGDSVSLAGSVTPKVWADRDGVSRPSLDMVASVVMTAYHVTRKRRAVSAEGDQPELTP